MTLLEILALLLIAGVTGSIAQSIVGISKGGCFISIVVGFIGAVVGTWVAGYLNLPEVFVIKIGEVDFPLFWALLGSIICSGFIALVSPRRV
jgi:uncharacterized membrane protein YeaQ/YmgE (transglycosylase-associated protein family)